MWQHSDIVKCVSCVPWEKVCPCGRSWRWAFSLFFCSAYKSPPFCMFSSATLKLRSAATCFIICLVWWNMGCCLQRWPQRGPQRTMKHTQLYSKQSGVWDLFILLGSNLSQILAGIYVVLTVSHDELLVWPMSHLLTKGLQPATRGPPGLHTRASYEDADSRFIFDLLSGLS